MDATNALIVHEIVQAAKSTFSSLLLPVPGSAEQPEKKVLAGYLISSVARGDFIWGNSDVDFLFLVPEGTPDVGKAAVVQQVASSWKPVADALIQRWPAPVRSWRLGACDPLVVALNELPRTQQEAEEQPYALLGVFGVDVDSHHIYLGGTADLLREYFVPAKDQVRCAAAKLSTYLSRAKQARAACNEFPWVAIGTDDDDDDDDLSAMALVQWVEPLRRLILATGTLLRVLALQRGVSTIHKKQLAQEYVNGGVFPATSQANPGVIEGSGASSCLPDERFLCAVRHYIFLYGAEYLSDIPLPEAVRQDFENPARSTAKADCFLAEKLGVAPYEVQAARNAFRLVDLL